MKKLEKAKGPTLEQGGALSYELVLEAALDEFLKDHDPEERKKRRRRTKGARGGSDEGGRPARDPRPKRRHSHHAAFPPPYERRRLRPGQRPLHVYRLERRALRGDASSPDRSCHPVREGRHERARQPAASLRKAQQARSGEGPGSEVSSGGSAGESRPGEGSSERGLPEIGPDVL